MRVGRFGPGDAAALALGLAFLYWPVTLVVAFSFNRSRSVTVWSGFSTEWYGALLANTALKEAAAVSLGIAVASASLATLLGTGAAVALARRGRFAGRTLMTGLLATPMVLPDVVLGLSLLLLFVGIGLDRGLLTVTIAHTTLTLSFVTVVVGARLASVDRHLEEAARDLGASALVAFLTVTLPAIAPAVASGWLLAFSLSLDDLVLASFASGPGATTLPMRIYGSVRLGVSPEINAASTILIGVVAVIVLAASLLGRRSVAGGR